MLKKDGKDFDIWIGDLLIIWDFEIQNFCLYGMVGVGKLEVICCLVNYVCQCGDMVVIYDCLGEFVKSYYDFFIDKILNLLDVCCVVWDLWKECLIQLDFDNIVNILILMGIKEDLFWQGLGCIIFVEVVYLMCNDFNCSYSKLVDILFFIKIEKLCIYLCNLLVVNLVEEKIEKMVIFICVVLINYVKVICYLQGIEYNGEFFIICDWMCGVWEDQKNGWLFILLNVDIYVFLKLVIFMWLFIVICGLLVMGENCNCCVWFFCDELFMLYKLLDLVEILLEVCKFGGCYVFGIQFYVQLEDIYGEKVVVLLFDVMNICVFFCFFSYKIVEFVVGEIGEKEYLKVSEQYFYGVDLVCDGVLIGKDMECQMLVSYFDIQFLLDLICYVILFGLYLVVKFFLKYQI